jgi:hypothetical protein
MINEIYRDNVPRGTPIVPLFAKWDNSGNLTLTLTPDEAMAIRVKGLLWSQSHDFTFVGDASTPKFLTISFPKEDGSGIKTINIDDVRQLSLLSKRNNIYEKLSGTDDVINYYILEFEAPVILKHSLASKSVTVTFTGASISAGELDLALIGWEKKEAEWGF